MRKFKMMKEVINRPTKTYTKFWDIIMNWQESWDYNQKRCF